MSNTLDPDRLDDLLDPWRDHPVAMVLRCGKCRRVFGRLVPHDSGPWIVLEGATTDHRAVGNGPRPSLWYSVGARPGEESGERLTLVCHRRCGARWVLRQDRLVVAYVRAARAGRTELVVGDDL